MTQPFPEGWAALLGVAFTLSLGSALQSAVGFGGALLAVPLLLHQGLSLPQAVATLLGAAVVQTGWGTWTHRALLRPGVMGWVASGQVVGIPLGLLLMALVAGVEPTWMRAAVSAAIVGSVVAWAGWRPAPVAEVARPWRVVAGLGAGVLGGLCGMAGPPLVLYALAHDWTRDRFRAFLWAQLLLGAPLVAAGLLWRFGAELGWNLAFGAACAPAVWAGFEAAQRLTRSWDGDRVRAWAVGLLLVVAAVNAAG